MMVRKVKNAIFIVFGFFVFSILILNEISYERLVDNRSKVRNILERTEDAGDEYINKIYFVGDSTTYHFKKVGIDELHILVPESHTLKLSSDILSINVWGYNMPIADALSCANAEIAIITIGVNGADSFTESRYKTYYGKLIDEIKERSPDTSIILQSVFPVTKDYSDKNIGITNDGIDRLNVWLKEIAFEKDVYYLDTQSILKDADGAQKQEYNEADGVHLNSNAYKVIIEYIRTHAIEWR